jgi:hypothetical protein
MNGLDRIYSSQRKVWRRAPSNRRSGKAGLGLREEIGSRGSGSDVLSSAGDGQAQLNGPFSSGASFIPMTDLGKNLWDARARIMNSFIPLLSRDDVAREVQERRG